MHENVHDKTASYVSRGKKMLTSLSVCNEAEGYDLYGVLDCLELQEDKNGVRVDNSNKKYNLCIVEYKPSAPKTGEFRFEDAMQVFAQKICVDAMFHCNCKAMIYYGDTKRREILPFDEQYAYYDGQLKETLCAMRSVLAQGVIPPIETTNRCNGCSLKDLCIPSVKGKNSKLRADILKLLEECTCENC